MNNIFYGWIAGSMSDFTKPFQENEQLYNQAKTFWRHLDGFMPIVIAIFIILGILLAWYYYKPFNDKPGRHYRLRYWCGFLAVTFFLTLALTLVLEYIVAKPTLNGAFRLELMIAIGNALYASVLYFLTSVVWCNALPTNAYRLLKF